MTFLPQILDQIWRAQRDREGLAEAAAQAMSPTATAELLAFVANARGRGWLKAKPLQGRQVLLTAGVGGFHALAIVTKDKRGATLVQLSDLGVRLATDSQTIIDMWGPPIVAPAGNLLRALQYVRDAVDSLLYRSDDRDEEIAQVSRHLGIDPDLLRALATTDRCPLSSVNA